MNESDLDRFTNAFIEAFYFADTGEDGQPDSDADLSEACRLDIEADCRSFWRRFGRYLTTETCRKAFDDPVTQAGYDFYMTRQGHGVGFWEDEWPGPARHRDLLTKAAKGYGELFMYQGDDGLIYC